MDRKMTFEIFKNIIVEQNKLLFKEIAKNSHLTEEYLTKNYLKPEYYLPVIVKTKKCQPNTQKESSSQLSQKNNSELEKMDNSLGN